MMPIDSRTREYNWEDILALIAKDMGCDPKVRGSFDIWYMGGFQEPQHVKDLCVRISKYDEPDYGKRLDSLMGRDGK